jgi:hypothetical protein
MKIAASILGVIAILLGGLWFLQGVGIVRIPPILCVANCEPIEGPAPVWAIVGLVVLLAGVLALVWGIRRRRS